MVTHVKRFKFSVMTLNLPSKLSLMLPPLPTFVLRGLFRMKNWLPKSLKQKVQVERTGITFTSYTTHLSKNSK